MGVLDALKTAASRLGGKAKEGLDAGKQKAAGLTDRDRSDSAATGDLGGTAPASARDSDLVGDEIYFGSGDVSSPSAPVDDLGAGAAGAAGTTEAADTLSPADIGAAATAPDPAATDSGVTSGEVPSVGDVADSPGFAEPEPTGDPGDLGRVGDLGEAGPATTVAESTTFSDATTGLADEPTDSGFRSDEESGGLMDSRDDALDAVQADDEEIRAPRDEP